MFIKGLLFKWNPWNFLLLSLLNLSHFWVYFYWLIFLFTIEFSYFFAYLVNFNWMIDIVYFTLFRCSDVLYFSKYSWTLFWDGLKLLETIRFFKSGVCKLWLQAKSGPQSISVNKVLLEYSRRHSFTYCLMML